MNNELGILLLILAATIIFIIFEWLRIDLIAVIIMLTLGWSGILSPGEMLSGFSSNAVIVVIAVMILGRGLEKTGLMDRFSQLVLSKVHGDKTRIIFWTFLAVGFISGFIQNIGAIALFLPGVISMARNSKIPQRELIMPIGFSAILGGTLTMVASGPLVLVNDLLKNANLAAFGMFSVTPVGLLLVFSGLLYFLIFGKHLLVKRRNVSSHKPDQDSLIERLNLPNNVRHFVIRKDSPLVGKTVEESILNAKPSVNVLALIREDGLEYAPWRGTVFKKGQEIAVFGSEENINTIAKTNKLTQIENDDQFDALQDAGRAGFAEVIIPNRSALSGKTIRDYAIRKRFGVEPILLYSRGTEIRENISDQVIGSGDAIIVYGFWDRIKNLRESLDFVIASSLQTDEMDVKNITKALLCYGIAIGFALFGFPVALAFFSGAVAMVMTRVITVEEMYKSIEWKVVFLLAGLIPLGVAMQKTGAAAYIAENVVALMINENILLLIISVGILSTIFSLVMTNSGAIVVLTPIIIEMAKIGGFDPRSMVLFAAVCTANSFILPTHQVNAYIQSSGGYNNADYFRTGGWMTIIFLLVTVSYFYIWMF